MTGSEKGEMSPSAFNECVSKDELHILVDDQCTYIDGKFDKLMGNIYGLVTRIEHVEHRPPPRRHRRQPYGDDEEEDSDADRLWRNHQGMGGNQNRGNNGRFAKTKFNMIPFAGTTDPEAYLDWQLAIEHKFNSHLVPPEHRVRLATSEFTSFALFR